MSMQTSAQPIRIMTHIGSIAVYVKENPSDKLPIIFLHGVYFDHHLWDSQFEAIKDRTVICLDMPLHGSSSGFPIKADWTLADCSDMLIEILDSLKIPKVIAVGHSWGSMTILRAAHKHPARFASIGLCNMPFHAASNKQKVSFRLQHFMLVFRNFYTKKSAKNLFGKATLQANPELFGQLNRPMSKLSNRQIRQIDKAVILDAVDATSLIKTLKVKAIALKGKEDYVPTPPDMETIVVAGGHVSPLEIPQEIARLVARLME